MRRIEKTIDLSRFIRGRHSIVSCCVIHIILFVAFVISVVLIAASFYILYIHIHVIKTHSENHAIEIAFWLDISIFRDISLVAKIQGYNIGILIVNRSADLYFSLEMLLYYFQELSRVWVRSVRDEIRAKGPNINVKNGDIKKLERLKNYPSFYMTISRESYRDKSKYVLKGKIRRFWWSNSLVHRKSSIIFEITVIQNFWDFHFNASQLLISPRHKLAFEYNSFDTELDRTSVTDHHQRILTFDSMARYRKCRSIHPHRGGVFDERRGCRSGRGSQWEQQRHCLGKRW